MEKPKIDDLAGFERYLLGLRKASGAARYTPRTARTYLSSASRVLANFRGDFIAAVSAGQMTPAGALARSAGLAWANWRGDAALHDRLKKIQVTDVTCEETKSVNISDWNRIEVVVRTRGEPERSALLLLVLSGLRIGDLFMLTRMQATYGVTNHEVSIMQKGQKARMWAPSQEEREALRALLAFPWRTYRDIFDPHAAKTSLRDDQHYAAAYYRVCVLLGEICREAGVPYVRPHRFRHTAACFIVHEKLGDVTDAQKMLGHADLRTTSKFYLHSEADRQADIKDQAAARRHRSKESS